MADLDVAIVAVDRQIWSGKATFVFTRTTAGEIGILPRHIPLVAQLVGDAMVRVEREGDEDLRIAVDGGFLSVTEHGVTILGPTNLPSTVPFHASQMYAKNITTLLLHLAKGGKLELDLQDAITRETLVTRGGEVVHPRVRELLGLPGDVPKTEEAGTNG